MKNLNLYLIRHGQTEWNIADRMQGIQNSPLTEKGVLGAKITGEYLKNTPFIQAYSSPLPRAMDTRDYILAENNVSAPTATLAGLSEMDFGAWEGQHVPELVKLDEFQQYLKDPENYQGKTNQGEKYLDVLNRMQRSLDEIVKNAPADNGNILIVSHATALRILLCVLNGGDWRKHRDDNYFPRILNTSISLVNYQGNGDEGTYTVKYFNDVNHIPD
ncbi:putative phosphoglycerate mutase [Frischella perrara]|uniref:Fructose-2,6-bisphosphatase n=1 Tax=Frischella perrara TaxID=1267021 RepID=A0A0A7RZ15_FRIPE|nr:histidine phosphatase family protein [Frischella perrara]AJA44458.1 Fructose-2,6-bisphosphatase [Frischella perrara]PWV60962.1 putative phosphoglycerate mutase [Frischella perrara]